MARKVTDTRHYEEAALEGPIQDERTMNRQNSTENMGWRESTDSMPLENQSRKILQKMEASHLGHPGGQKRNHLERKVKEGFGHLCSLSRTGLASCALFVKKKKNLPESCSYL